MIPIRPRLSGRGFQICFFSPLLGEIILILQMFFNWVETTNYRCVETCHGVSTSQFVWDIMTTLQRGTKQKKVRTKLPNRGGSGPEVNDFFGGLILTLVFFFRALYFFPTKIKLIIGETKQVISKKVVEVVQACVYVLPTSASNIVLVLDV